MGELQVTIVEGRDLKKKDFFSESDPFVRIYLDDKKHRQTTKVINNNKNPQWNQTFFFNHLKGQNDLHVEVLDKDIFIHDRIGSIKIDLQELYEKGHIDNWYDLPSRFGRSSHGQIHLILDYYALKL